MLPPLQVREAMAGLLVAVSRTRALHFYEVRTLLLQPLGEQHRLAHFWFPGGGGL